MAKQLIPPDPVPIVAFPFSSSALADVFQLMVFVAWQNYYFDLRCNQTEPYAVPTITATITPKTPEKRKLEPTITIANTDWVLWDGQRFTCKTNAEIQALGWSIEDYVLPPPPQPPQPDPEPEPQPEPEPEPEQPQEPTDE